MSIICIDFVVKEKYFVSSIRCSARQKYIALLKCILQNIPTYNGHSVTWNICVQCTSVQGLFNSDHDDRKLFETPTQFM